MALELINQIIQGALIGGLYVLFAIGLSLSLGVMRFVNIAHGDLIVLASFILMSFSAILGLSPFIAAALLMPVAFLAFYALQRLLLQRLVGTNLLGVILVTFGLAIVIQNGLLQTYGPDTRKLSGGALELKSISIGGGLSIGLYPLLVFATAVVVIFALDRFLYRTSIGSRIRAVADDPAAADLIGLPSAKIYGIAMGVVGLTVMSAACCMSVWTNFDPEIGPSRLLIAFEVVVLGGLGSLWGTLVGGIIIGVAQNLGAQVDAAWQILAQHLVFLVILFLRPQGLYFPRISHVSNPSGLARHFPSAGATADKASRLQMLTLALRILLVVAIVLLGAGPWLFDLNQLTLLTEFFTLLVLALMWNLLAGYADIVTVGQQGFVGVGAYAFFGLAALAGLDPFLSIILAAVITAVLAVPALLFILRLRLAYLAVGTWVLADVLSLIAGKLPGFGGGSGVSLPISIARAFGGSVSQQVHHALYIGVHPGSRSVNGDVVFASFACRPRVDGDARQRRRRQICGRRRAADARHLLSLDCAVSRFGRRAGHAAKGACRAVRVVQYHRLDHLYYLCCRYRRHRQPRGTDYRNRSLSLAPRISG